MQHRKEFVELLCEYPTCSEPTLNAVVVTRVCDEHMEHRNYCSELHAALALLEVVRTEVVGYYAEFKAKEYILQFVGRSLAGEPITYTRQDGIDRVVDRILST